MFSYGIVVVATPRVRIDRYMIPPCAYHPLQHCTDTQNLLLIPGKVEDSPQKLQPLLILFAEHVILPLNTGSVNNVLPLACDFVLP